MCTLLMLNETAFIYKAYDKDGVKEKHNSGKCALSLQAAAVLSRLEVCRSKSEQELEATPRSLGK